MSSNKDRPILEAVLESTETALDVIMNDEVISSIPVIGTAWKVSKALDAIRDRAFAAKLIRFATIIADIPQESRDSLKRKVASSSEELNKIRETLFLILDRLTDLDKPTLLGYIFLAYLDDKLTSSELRRLAQAIDISFSDDLSRMLESPGISNIGIAAEPWMKHLVLSGLIQLSSKTNPYGVLGYEVSPLGSKLQDAYFHARALRKR